MGKQREKKGNRASEGSKQKCFLLYGHKMALKSLFIKFTIFVVVAVSRQ